MHTRHIDLKRIAGALFSAALLSLGLSLLFGQEPAKAQAGADALQFFKNYFITGDFFVRGVGLSDQGVDGFATGQIVLPAPGDPEAPPEGADVAAAWLFWQVVAKSSDGPYAGALGVTFNGMPLSSTEGPFGKPLGLGTPPCWSHGGGTGQSGGAHLTLAYRADVLWALDYDEVTGKPRLTGSYDVRLPDDNNTLALGASLVVVYRDTSKPLSAIVIDDGITTMDQVNEQLFHRIRGFFEGDRTGKLALVMGSGSDKKSEILYVNGIPLITNPFTSAQGDHWDNPTFTLGETYYPIGGPTDYVDISVDHAGFNSFDCLTWSAAIYRTYPPDTDRDGVPNVLESWDPAIQGPLLDPKGQVMPNLKAMGGDPLRQDVYLEIAYMKTDEDLTYDGVLKPAHTHRPTHETVKYWCEAFKNAPVSNPDGSWGIDLHVDLGNDYPPGDPSDPKKNADECIIRDGAVPGLARGGEFIDEILTTRDPMNPDLPCVRGATDPPGVCQFADDPGTLGYLIGLKFFMNELLSETPPPITETGEDPCDRPYDPSTGEPNTGPGGACERRFDRVRKDIFHFGAFVHNIAIPRSEWPCLVESPAGLIPGPADSTTGLCAVADNPDFYRPMSISGVGGKFGGDFIVSLGSFNDHEGAPVGEDGVWTPFPTGTPFNVAGTAFHELGHNFGLDHGGREGEENCKPVYTSIMNYPYQLVGLRDNDGEIHMDFSHGLNPAIDNEGNLVDFSFPPRALTYRIGWYAPLGGSYLEGRATPVSRHCNGSFSLPTDVPMARFDSRNTHSVIDWNGNGTTETGYALDLNFNGWTTDGTAGELLEDYNDWANVRLDQVGSRRSAGSLFPLVPAPEGCPDDPCLALGPRSLDATYSDYSAFDYAQSDYGRSGYGRSGYGRSGYGADLSRGDLGVGDYGRSGYGRSGYGRSGYGRSGYGRSGYGAGDQGRGYLGGGDLSLNDPSGGGELDADLAKLLLKAPVIGFSACTIGVDPDCTGDPSEFHRVLTDWTAPPEGAVFRYDVYSVLCGELQPGEECPLSPEQDWNFVGSVFSEPDTTVYSLVDGSQLVNGASYLYFARACYDDGICSDIGNVVPIIGINDPPVAGNDLYQTAEDVPFSVSAPGVLANDDDPDTDNPLTAVLVSGPSHGTLTLNADGSFSYAPAPNYYGADSFTYKATDGLVDSNIATVDITVTAVNDVPVAVDDTYFMTWPSLTVGAPGVLTNDPPDVEGSVLTASLVNGPSTGTLVFNADGSFTYTPGANTTGPVSFTYRAYDGSDYSNVATVRITAYFLVGYQNVPPARVSAVKSGSTQPMQWGYENETGRVESSHVGHTVTVQGTNGAVYTFKNTDPGSSSFKYDALTQTHSFNLQTKDQLGVAYPPGTYRVTIMPDTPGYLPRTFDLSVRK